MLEHESPLTDPQTSAPAPVPPNPAPETPAPETPGDMVEVKDVGGVRQIPRAEFEPTARENYGMITGFKSSQQKARERGAKQAVDTLLASIDKGEDNETVRAVKERLNRSAAAPGAAPALVSTEIQKILDDPEISAEAEGNPVVGKLVQALKLTGQQMSKLAEFNATALKQMEEKLAEGGNNGILGEMDRQEVVAQAKGLMANPKAKSLFSYEGAGDVSEGLSRFLAKYADYYEKTDDVTPLTFEQFVDNTYKTHFGSSLKDAAPASAEPQPRPEPLPSSPGAVARGSGAAGDVRQKPVSEMNDEERAARFRRKQGLQATPLDLLGTGGAKAANRRAANYR